MFALNDVPLLTCTGVLGLGYGREWHEIPHGTSVLQWRRSNGDQWYEWGNECVSQGGE